MLAATGFGTGAAALIDIFNKAKSSSGSGKVWGFIEDLTVDSDGLAIHRLQALIFNVIVLSVVWIDLIAWGTVAMVDKSWSTLIGASTLTYLFGKASEPKK